MDLSKLSSNERTAAIGAAALVVGGLVAAGSYAAYGLGWIGVLAGVAVLFIVLAPQVAPAVNLPGSRSSLMLLAAGIGAVVMLLAFLTLIGFTFSGFTVIDLFWLIGVAGAVVMAWAAWQAFQADGGTFRLGSGPASDRSEPAADDPASAPTGTEETERPERA